MNLDRKTFLRSLGAGALGVFLMIGGFVALIANMRDDRDGNDDDGAVV